MSALKRLLARIPPPSRPAHARGDREAARAAMGWAVPDHVFEVLEAYGEVGWIDWMLLPSPWSASGLGALRNRVGASERTLIAFSDPEEAVLFIGADGFVSVMSPAGAVDTGKPLADVLLSWLDGGESYGLPTPAELLEDAPLEPFAVPLWDEQRPARITWLHTRGGLATRAARWDAFREALGPHVPTAVRASGERQQDHLYLGELECSVIFDSYNKKAGAEQIHVRCYLDRLDAVKALVSRALAAAKLEVVRADSPRGAVEW